MDVVKKLFKPIVSTQTLAPFASNNLMCATQIHLYLPKDAPKAAEIVGLHEAETRLFRAVRCDSRHVFKKHLPPQKVQSITCASDLTT